MSTDGLTDRQAECLQVLTRQIEAGKSPTLQEIGIEMGIKSRGSVHTLLVSLRDRGKIQWIDGRNRSIVLVPDRRAGHVLTPDLQARLEKFCKQHDEKPSAVIHDALALHFDALEGEKLAETA